MSAAAAVTDPIQFAQYDPCPQPKCPGVMHVANTKVDEEAGMRIRYLACSVCGFRPANNALMVPLEFAPRRFKVRRMRHRR